MYAVGRLGSYISQGVYAVSGPFHPFGGAVDIIVVEQPDGSFKSSPWYVRFGKFQGVLKTREKIVNISVNGNEADVHMYLSHKGEAYFLQEVEVEEGESLSTPSYSSDETDGQSITDRALLKSKTCNFDANGKVVARTNSRRSRILGLVFGQRLVKDDHSQGVGGSGIERESSLDRAEFAANLLEVKWSTNIAIDRLKDNKDSPLSLSATSDGGHGKNTGVGSAQSQRSLDQGNNGNSLDHHSLQDATGSCNEESVMIKGVVEEQSQSALEISRVVDEYNVDTTDQHAIENGLSVPPEDQLYESNALPEKCVVTPACGISDRSISERDQSFYYCEKLENSVEELNASLEQLHEKLRASSSRDGEVQALAETLHQKMELLQQTEMLTVCQDKISEKLSDNSELEPVEIVKKSHSQVRYSSISFTGNYDEVCPQQSVVISESYGDSIGSVSECSSAEKVDLQKMYTSFSSNGPGHEVEDNGSTSDVKDQVLLESFCSGAPGKLVKIPSSDSSEEQQFLFSDLDESTLSDDQCRIPLSLDVVDEKNIPSCSPQGYDKVNQSPQENHELFLSSNKPQEEEQLNDLESLKEKSEAVSNSINIPRSCEEDPGEDWQRKAESLPNMPLKMDNLYANDISPPQCYSVGSNPESLKWAFLKGIDQSCTKTQADKDLPEQVLPTAEETRSSVLLKDYIAKNAVEVSLCKHLLYEGMGMDAASQAFDSEKLDMNKFTSMGPEIVKNDKLVVRIGGHYFPWDSAAAQVLGLLSYGNNHKFEPKGMIAVDLVESPELNPSKTAVASNGSWRLWPFSFRRSRSQKDTQSVRDGAGCYNSETASESENVKLKVVKKMIRARRPTSEQLASLNLKEGRNVVTFTFSTPMLGKQQVDASIYLWKWNTRIVISDVDGTITKSDVLGQFMPLVGVDWSQTGVTNLFSAIKENGYQLLFLSARAISQAYHTRQFLFNLKQDGKALPDGPVVISPDGLFPSLFREVIRRAPHEFKIACLEDIKALFPPDCNPFYAGFGNRNTDEISYLKVGIPRGKIFTINPKGDIAVNRCVDTKSYTSLHALVNGMFPPMSSGEQEDFNSWNYWKLPPPVLDV